MYMYVYIYIHGCIHAYIPATVSVQKRKLSMFLKSAGIAFKGFTSGIMA